jgi:hypothetical protein
MVLDGQMEVFRRKDEDINSRLKRYRLGLVLIAVLGLSILAFVDTNSSLPSLLFSFATSLLVGSYLFEEGRTLDEVSISDRDVRYGNRVYPIEKISKVRVRESRSGDLSLKIWAAEMDSLVIPKLPGLDRFVEKLLQHNPTIEII